MSTTVRSQRGRKQKHFSEEAKSKARLDASLKFNKTEKGKKARNRYRVKQRDNIRKAKMVKYFSDNPTLCKETLIEALKNEQIRNILKELMHPKPE
jgi:hypothetical protein